MTVELPATGGASLVADDWGDPAAPPLLLLHGGGQTRGAWGSAGPRLAGLGWRVLAVDLRGHGESDWARDGRYNLDLFAADVRTVVGDLDAPPVLVGASLGGLSAMLAAGEGERAEVRGLVLVDVAHRHEPDGVQRIVEFMRSRPEGFADLAEAADAIADYLPDRERPADDSGLERNLRARDGRWVWHWDPRVLDGLEVSAPDPLDPRRILAAARSVGAPILLVRGGSSDVLSAEAAAEFCRLVPGAETVEVPGAGHMVAGDRNERFAVAIEPFVARLR